MSPDNQGLTVYKNASCKFPIVQQFEYLLLLLSDYCTGGHELEFYTGSQSFSFSHPFDN